MALCHGRGSITISWGKGTALYVKWKMVSRFPSFPVSEFPSFWELSLEHVCLLVCVFVCVFVWFFVCVCMGAGLMDCICLCMFICCVFVWLCVRLLVLFACACVFVCMRVCLMVRAECLHFLPIVIPFDWMILDFLSPVSDNHLQSLALVQEQFKITDFVA